MARADPSVLGFLDGGFGAILLQATESATFSVMPMRIPIYQIDAFSDRVFAGNPAAVCPLDTWPDDDLLQAVATENSLSETAFLVSEGAGYRIRWFTPVAEGELCGHATMAAAYVVFEFLDPAADRVSFESRSDELAKSQNRDGKAKSSRSRRHMMFSSRFSGAIPRNESR